MFHHVPENLKPMEELNLGNRPNLVYLDLLKMPGKGKKIFPKWWFDGDLPWKKVKHHLKQV